MSEGVLNRFLKYVRYDTQSVRESDTEPSSAKELVLAEELVRELKDLGITDARIGKGGVVYATIPATKGCEECPAVGFIAHMDTSPDASGTDVKPQILRFTGDDVLLNAEKNDSSGICVGSSSPDFGQREPVNKYGESPR